MLDQNTDRMWFVIGAVIVGAAIIFIANGTMPEIFASVTNTFEEASENVLTEIDNYEGNQQLDTLQRGFLKSAWENGGLNINSGVSGSRIELDSAQYYNYRIRQKDYYVIDHVSRFKMTFNDNLYQLRPTFYSEDKVTIRAKWYTESGEVDVPEDAKYIRFTAGPFDLSTGGYDREVSLDEFEQLDIQFEIIN